MYYVHRFRKLNFLMQGKPQPTSSPTNCLFGKIVFEHNHAIYLCIFFDCLRPTMAELICYNRCYNSMAHPQSLKYLHFSSLQKAFADTFLMCELPPNWSINLTQSNSNPNCHFHKNQQVNYTHLYAKVKDLE